VANIKIFFAFSHVLTSALPVRCTTSWDNFITHR